MGYYTKHMFDHFAHGIGEKKKKSFAHFKRNMVIIKEVTDDKKNEMLLIKLAGSFALML